MQTNVQQVDPGGRCGEEDTDKIMALFQRQLLREPGLRRWVIESWSVLRQST
ncbi:MAG: hypothetical protein ABSB74_08765 [Tepidisphaeraceae bacterium]